MKKHLSKIAILAAFAGATSIAQADELPIKGTCEKGTEKVSFSGSRMPIKDTVTGDFGVTQIWMSYADYEKFLEPHIDILDTQPDQNGLNRAAIGALGVSVKVDSDQDSATFRAQNHTFKIYFEDHDKHGVDFYGWQCDVKPDL